MKSLRDTFGTYHLLILGLAWTAGCGSGSAYKLGERMEKNGKVVEAYAAYCRAANQDPGNSTVANAIRRLLPQVAEHWESRAHQEVQAGRYANAWRAYMKALEARPDHPNLPQIIRQLETQHSAELAIARADYERLGNRSLHGPVAVAAIVPAPDAGDDGSVISTDEPEDRGSATDIARSPQWSGPYLTAAESPNGTTSPSFSGSSGRTKESSATSRHEPASSPASKEIRPLKRKRDENRADDARPAYRAALGQNGGGNGYLVVHTLSKRDDRLGRKVEAIDGITVELRDTDGDQDSDFDLHAGHRRVQKIRELRVHSGATFRGRSGRRYRLVVLSVRHSTRTATFGIKED